MRVEVQSFTIDISGNIFNLVSNFIQCGNESESGGVLFGKRQIDSNIYCIIDMSIPNQNDKATRFSFVRNAKAAQKIIEEKWKKSDGFVNYIGEWHTHPESSPSPSKTDIKTYKKISKDKSSLFPISINLIFGNANKFYICGYRDGKIIFEEVITCEKFLCSQS